MNGQWKQSGRTDYGSDAEFKPRPGRGHAGAHRRFKSRFTRRRKMVLSAGFAALLIPAMVAGTLAAWTVDTLNPGNTFTTTTILLQDNQGGQGGTAENDGTAMFNVANLEPGSAATTKCIGVVFAGTAPTGVGTVLTLTATLGGTGQATLQSELTMNVAKLNTSGTVSVTGGTNTNLGSCTSPPYPAGGSDTTIGVQGASLAAWATASPYTIATPVTNTWYKFTVSGLPGADTDCFTYCNKTITIELKWTLTTA